MELRIWIYLILVYISLVHIVRGEKNGKGLHQSSGDNDASDISNHNVTYKPLQLLRDNLSKDHKVNLLTPIANNHEEPVEDDDDDDATYLDYDYENKEINYKDSPEGASLGSNLNSEETSIIDDKIPLHTSRDNLPIFLLEPESTYVVKNKPATLKCRAANALEIYFKCNGVKTKASNLEFVDPQSGVRIIEGEYNVTRENVEEYFGTNKYQCTCYAWTSRGQIKSQSATVEVAYIKKVFTMTPESKVVQQNSPVALRCEPPPAAPFAQMYWLKNGAPIVIDDNVHITLDGSLQIKQASLLDIANYTCVAENLAGKRMTDPVLLTVYVNGGWTAWSSWTECWCPGQRNEGTSGRRRVRTCTDPRPLNGGQPCIGPSVQKTPDCSDCDLDVYVDALDDLEDDTSDIITGHWSRWSEWSGCDNDCLQRRRRRCLSSTGCLGEDVQVKQCPLCVRRSKSNIIHNNGSTYWPLFTALLVAFIILIVVIWLGLKYMKIKMNESSSYVKPQSGQNYLENVIKRTLTNQPDLTIHEEFHTIDPRRQRCTSLSMNPRNEHLYEIPQLASSYISPIDHEVISNINGSTRNYSCNENLQSDPSDSSCFLSSGSSYGNESIEMSPSLKNNASTDSKFHISKNHSTFVSKIVSSDGDCLNLDKYGVTLFIPDGVIDKGEELFTIEVTNDDLHIPKLQEGETLLSPVIRCGPKNYHFRKAVVLSFAHFACLEDNSWLLSILQKSENINTKEWRKVLTLGQETPGTPLFVQIDPCKVFLVCEYLSDFVLIGKSFSGLDAKIIKICIFLSSKMDDGYYILKVHVMNDIPHALVDCLESEKRCGSSMICEPKSLNFQENCSDLCLNLREIGIGWKIHSGGKYQELPYSGIWNNCIRSSQCTFVLQQTDANCSLELTMTVYQKQMQSNSVNIIRTNDLNCNFKKRFSSCSVETGHDVNIVENPFNYSSLTKKEGRYDYVYRNTNSLYKSNFNIDSYRVNVLTKSDRIILCKLLDCRSSKGNDWRLLAEKLNLGSFYYYFSNTSSPTESLLNLWLLRNNDSNMLLNLAKIFRVMSRIDCATVVERRCLPN